MAVYKVINMGQKYHEEQHFFSIYDQCYNIKRSKK